MGNGGYILDKSNLKTYSLESSDSSFSSCAGALNVNLDSLKTVLHSSSCSSFSSSLSSERSGLLGSSETESAGGRPRKCVALSIGDGYDCVVESGLDMNSAIFNVLTFTTSSDGSSFLPLT